MKTIGEVAELASVSTQTLRWYDRIGLLRPRARSHAGYRLYGTEELLRLREILIWRQLGFPLVDVAALIDDPGHDRGEALRRQRELAVAQRDKFHALTRGLDLALESIGADRSVTDSEVFAGFARNLADDDEDDGAAPPSGSEARTIPTFALLSGRSHHGTAHGPADSSAPRRIVATEPIRLGENLLALGVLPVGVGSFVDQSTRELYCPWPELVEAPIRDQVRSVGSYGSDKELIAAAEPDLILDLRLVHLGATMAEHASFGRYSHDDLCEIAPTVLFQAPIGAPAFLGRIEELAGVLLLEGRVEPLRACWHARTRVLREHVAGQSVSALNTTTFRIDAESDATWFGWAPGLRHEAQVFSALGLELVAPSALEHTHPGGLMRVTEENLGELTGPTLFVTVDDHGFAAPIRRLVSRGRLADLPAVRAGRVFDYRWSHMRSGWFTAHCQLDVIARAFGISCLRTMGLDAPVHLAITPEGKATAVSTVECGAARLSGPGLPGVGLDLEPGIPAGVELEDVAGDVCAFPQGYSLTTERSGTRRLVVDREGALDRIAQQRLAA